MFQANLCSCPVFLFPVPISLIQIVRQQADGYKVSVTKYLLSMCQAVF